MAQTDFDWMRAEDKQIITLGAKVSPRLIDGKYYWTVDKFFDDSTFDYGDVSPNASGVSRLSELINTDGETECGECGGELVRELSAEKFLCAECQADEI